jgi:hypothetical protein
MENELYHHGVKGQHWGKRNGPPYPLYRKSAYYKKTGQRPPGYTGNKKGKSNSGETNKSGRVGGLKDIKRAGDTSWVRKRLKKGKIGGINDSMSDEERKAKLKKRILIGAGVAAGLAGGALVGRKLYQRKAALGAQGVAEEAKNLHKNFLKNRAAQKEASSIKEGLDKAYQDSSKAIKAERAGMINKKLSLQNEGLGLKDAKGIRAYFKRRKNAKALNEIEQRLAANSTKSANATKNYSKKLANNALNADNASANYERAKKAYERAKESEAALKKLGNKQALASALGLGAIGGAAGYGVSKPSRYKNQNRGTIGGLSDIKRAGGLKASINTTRNSLKRNKNGKIGGLTKRMTVSSTDSAVTRRAKAAYNSMSDAEFRRKYSVSKAEYARRVEKYGDPYKNSPMAKLGRRLSRRRRRR